MTKLTLEVPTVGEKNTVAEPKVDTALKAIETWANGEVGTSNITAGTVTEAMLTSAVQTLLNEKTAGGVLTKKITAGEEERESAVYGTLTTPDEVEVEMPTNGLFAIWYDALWKASTATPGRAAIFLGANQLKINVANGAAPVTQAAGFTGGNAKEFAPLTTSPIGLLAPTAGNTGSGADVVTGQIVGSLGNPGAPTNLEIELGGTLVESGSKILGGPVWVFAAAGKYKISVQFKVAAGNVKVKERKLKVLAYT